MAAKFNYDKRHKPLTLAEGQSAYLRLYKGYNIPRNATITRKLGQQYTGPFKILRKVGRLAYELEFPTHWRVHPVVSVAMLEPAPGLDPFGRPIPEQPDSVHVEGDTASHKSWEVERHDLPSGESDYSKMALLDILRKYSTPWSGREIQRTSVQSSA